MRETIIDNVSDIPSFNFENNSTTNERTQFIFDVVRFLQQNINLSEIAIILNRDLHYDKAKNIDLIANAIGILSYYLSQQIITLLAENISWQQMIATYNMNVATLLSETKGLQIEFNTQYSKETIHYLIESCALAVQNGSEREEVEFMNILYLYIFFYRNFENTLINNILSDYHILSKNLPDVSPYETACFEISPPLYSDQTNFMFRIYTKQENSVQSRIFHVPCGDNELQKLLAELSQYKSIQTHPCLNFKNQVLSTIYFIPKTDLTDILKFIPLIRDYSQEVRAEHDDLIKNQIELIFKNSEITDTLRILSFEIIKALCCEYDKNEQKEILEHCAEQHALLLKLILAQTPALRVHERLPTEEERRDIVNSIRNRNAQALPVPWSIRTVGPCGSFSVVSQKQYYEKKSGILDVKIYLHGKSKTVKVDTSKQEIFCPECGNPFTYEYDCENHFMQGECPICKITAEEIFQKSKQSEESFYQYSPDSPAANLALSVIKTLLPFIPIEQI
jgi:hypothetical protein